MSNTGSYKRRQYFINKEFQGRTIFNYFILLALGTFLFVGIFSFFSANTLSIVYDNYHLQLGTTPGILFKKMLSTQWLFIVIGGMIIIFITLRLTHRVAGPFFRFEKALAEMTAHDISKKITLRQKDEGKELAQRLNDFNSGLARQLTFMDDQNYKIAVSAGQLETILAQKDQASQVDQDPGEMLRILEIIKESQKNIEAEVKKYTLNSTPRS
jgi:methyl-accepting chemotaxis protein